MQTQAISKKITNLAPSQTLAMTVKARELEAQGHKIIKLSLGEPDFLTPEHITSAAKKAIDEGFFSYSPVPGYPDLRQAIAAKFKRDNNLDYTIDNIVCSTGAKQSLMNVLQVLVNPGDEVIVFSPYWVSYMSQVKLVEGKAVTITGSLENDFKVTAVQLEAAITPQTKAILYSSPCNPTGSVYSRAELESLSEVLAKHEHVYIISDEIYEYINYEEQHESIAQFETIKDRVVVVNGLSKGFAMTGWRLGYIAAPVAIAKACTKFQGQVTSGTCSITQRAAIAALTESLAPTHAMCRTFKTRRDLVLDLIGEIEGVKANVPRGAFYLFPDISSFFGKSYAGKMIANGFDLSMYLLKEAGVAVVDGAAFGEPNCIRLSFAASESDLKIAIPNLKRALDQLD